MNLNDFTQYFDNPAVSVFNRSKSVSFPVKIGGLYPAKWELLSFGNSQKSNSAHSLRLAPLVAPSFTDLQFQNISAVVPLRTIIADYEESFNYAKNRDGHKLPSLTSEEYYKLLLALTRIGISPVGSLLDFLGYPVFADVFKSIDFAHAYIEYNVSGNSSEYSLFDSVPYPWIAESLLPSESFSSTLYFEYRDLKEDILGAFPFVAWLAYATFNEPLKNRDMYIVRKLYASIPNAVNSDGSISSTYTPSLDELIQASIFNTSKEAIDSYKLYLFSLVLDRVFLSDSFGDSSFTTLPLRAYLRFHYDWNTNGNFIDRDLFLEQFVFNLETVISEEVSDVLDNNSSGEILKDIFVVKNRLWNDDFFTSLLPTSTVDNAVEIPANSTVLDLAKLTAWQKFVMRLSYSSRYRDVVWNIFKIKPSDARLVQSYPIFRSYDNVGIGEVNQTSSSDVSGVLGGFAGRGYSSGRNKGYSIFCEEPCIVIDFVSLMPRAKYADSLHPLIHVDDILDFPLPEMDVLGNQPLRSDLISGFPGDNSIVLGYGRQYQEWLSNYSTVHGDFKTTLDYWTIARRFSDTPVINDDFLRIHPADDLDVIFSLQGENHAFLDLYYNAHVTRHVHRNVRIKI